MVHCVGIFAALAPKPEFRSPAHNEPLGMTKCICNPICAAGQECEDRRMAETCW